jgi:GNAT superfamily N-acetyltransferase
MGPERHAGCRATGMTKCGMTETWRVRLAHEADAPTIAQHRYPDSQGEHLEQYAAWLVPSLAEGTYVGWLGEAGGAVVAGAGLVLLGRGPTRDDPNPVRGRIGNVYTEPAWRQRGLATTLLQRCLAEAEAREVRVLNLSTSSRARTLYERLGFEVSRTEMVRLAPNLPCLAKSER